MALINELLNANYIPADAVCKYERLIVFSPNCIAFSINSFGIVHIVIFLVLLILIQMSSTRSYDL